MWLFWNTLGNDSIYVCVDNQVSLGFISEEHIGTPMYIPSRGHLAISDNQTYSYKVILLKSRVGHGGLCLAWRVECTAEIALV